MHVRVVPVDWLATGGYLKGLEEAGQLCVTLHTSEQSVENTNKFQR